MPQDEPDIRVVVRPRMLRVDACDRIQKPHEHSVWGDCTG
jgi:hypothetical protein